MKKVFLVQHARERDEEEEVKIIGIYSSLSAANDAVMKLALQDGFRDYPDGFHVDPYVVDQTCWEEGFVTAFGGPNEQ